MVLRKLVNRRVLTAKDLLTATQLELVEALDLPFETIEQLMLHVCGHISPNAVTVCCPNATAGSAIQHHSHSSLPSASETCRHQSCLPDQSSKAATWQHSCQALILSSGVISVDLTSVLQFPDTPSSKICAHHAQSHELESSHLAEPNVSASMVLCMHKRNWLSTDVAKCCIRNILKQPELSFLVSKPFSCRRGGIPVAGLTELVSNCQFVATKMCKLQQVFAHISQQQSRAEHWLSEQSEPACHHSILQYVACCSLSLSLFCTLCCMRW